MNIDSVKNEIKSLLNTRVMIKINGSRSKSVMCNGVINNIYPNIFTVLIDGVNRSFSYSDVAIGDVKIYHM